MEKNIEGRIDNRLPSFCLNRDSHDYGIIMMEEMESSFIMVIFFILRIMVQTKKVRYLNYLSCYNYKFYSMITQHTIYA